ncbi:aluminum-activated malate transporter 8 [Ziziphus jujuba]|uniref:Aluminum-activated malate transporter 8 n=1 Tax=Ziziphus jujuba TaxID=326968 RepID=A0A6P4AWU9_ZIZJJ|nr:aluminum-activated malate transporter 8 [Ziziphus jujuba]
METESATQQKAGLLAQGWGWFKALPEKFNTKVAEVSKSIKKLGKDDPRRVIHSLKVGLALTLVSLLYYWRPLFDGFGIAGIWAVLTVVVVFEFTVGATLYKSLNRGFATLLAGALGIGAQHLASLFAEREEPIVHGILVFLLAGASTFARFFPGIKAKYDYGVLIFILTFSMITVSGFRVGELLEMAHQRLSTILIGGSACIFISIFICPVWAGGDLHNLIASNIEKLAAYLDGFGEEYFQISEDVECVTATKNDKSFPQEYKSVLASKNTEESLANFARWEPGHGKFLFRHPWKQYLKIGAFARQCAYLIETLSTQINSEDIQVPAEFVRAIEAPCTKMSSASAKALKALASSIKTMKIPIAANQHVEDCKCAVQDLKTAMESVALESLDLLAIIPAATVASVLVEIVNCVEKISESVNELSQLAHFKKVDPTVSPEKPHLLHRGTVNPVLDGDSVHDVVITVHGGGDDDGHDDHLNTQENENHPPQPTKRRERA